MIEGIVKKIMLTGIEKYAKLWSEESKNVQIRIKILDDEIMSDQAYLQYQMCKNYQPKEVVTFLQIIDKKFDILGYEAMSSPFIAKSLASYAEKQEVNLQDVSCFIIKHEKSLMINFYVGVANTKNIPLGEFLTEAMI